MSYIYPIEPAEMFEDRMAQILSFGIPYVEASKTFPVRFERRILTLPYAGGTVEVAVHLLGGPEDRKDGGEWRC